MYSYLFINTHAEIRAMLYSINPENLHNQKTDEASFLLLPLCGFIFDVTATGNTIFDTLTGSSKADIARTGN